LKVGFFEMRIEFFAVQFEFFAMQFEFFAVQFEFFAVQFEFFAMQFEFFAMQFEFFARRIRFFEVQLDPQRARIVAYVSAAGFYTTPADYHATTVAMKQAQPRFFTLQGKLNALRVSVLAARIDLICVATATSGRGSGANAELAPPQFRVSVGAGLVPARVRQGKAGSHKGCPYRKNGLFISLADLP
jgi:hypothetical protein